jgi:hypothetical protein
VGIAVIALSNTPSAENANIEKLVMPGAVIAGHAKFENQCEKCHDTSNKTTQSRLCRDCHDAIDTDIASGRGFHGRSQGIKSSECRSCHTDHIGRNSDIVHLDTGTFHHENTDYVLKGAHQQVRCSSCHLAGKKYRNAPQECVGCHRGDDPHKGKLGDQCNKCHNEQGWRAPSKESFDHNKTRFLLRGSHEKVGCESCHPQQRFKEVAHECIDCHRVNDAHGGRFGSDCGKCHSESRWREVKFDHNRDTKYELKGRHQNVTCDACHPRTLQDKVSSVCVDCHRSDDVHKGSNGPKCGDCHNVNGWGKVQFDHDSDTHFPLRGRHASVACGGCHRSGAQPKDAPTECIGCHKKDDIHKGSFGDKCASCHNERAWKAVVFDHNKDTKFPLRGAHAKTKCEQCHTGGDFQRKLGTSCNDCHQKDDVHKGQQGAQCDRCHNEEVWKGKVRFDHDLTQFPLIGIHAVTACEECHVNQTFKDTSKACVKCHDNKDVHKRSLGENCESCHNPNDWRLWRFDHNKQTKFELDGAHAEVSCAACHKVPLDGNVKLPSDCIGCHRDDDVHDGGFGPQCDRCHNTKSFHDVEVIR